ncbi:MAG: Ldh family oxidoreductase, partial [Chloroflexi bacterium]|nr:Ldh family oxidoreductase [Chloroflexota bacterium]
MVHGKYPVGDKSVGPLGTGFTRKVGRVVETVGQQKRILAEADKLREFAAQVFLKLGVPEDDARISADVLVRADLRGVETHGISNNNLGRIYVRGIKDGRISPKAKIKIVHETPVTAVVDGDGGLGLMVGVRAMNIAIEKARSSYIGLVSVCNSRHFGMAQYFSMMAVLHGMIGISSTNASPLVLPTGGKEAVVGTNPISVAAPSGVEAPYCLDMGTSAIVFQKVILTARLGKTLPLGVAADKDGKPTTDPLVARDARKLFPLGSTPELGSHKGYGLGILVDILCGLLSGQGASIQLGVGGGSGAGSGHFFGAIRVDAFRPMAEFQAQMDDMIQRIHRTPTVEGVEKVLVAGEIEHTTEQKRL